MSEGQEADVTLLEFLDKLSEESGLDWNDRCDLFDSYCEKAKLPNTYYAGDWIEISPAFEALAAMIRAGVFRADRC